MTADNAPPAQDPVVVYDLMREAANRLIGVYAQRGTVGGLNDPAVQAIIAVLDEVEAVDPRDVGAQRAATEVFRARYASERKT